MEIACRIFVLEYLFWNVVWGFCCGNIVAESLLSNTCCGIVVAGSL